MTGESITEGACTSFSGRASGMKGLWQRFVLVVNSSCRKIMIQLFEPPAARVDARSPNRLDAGDFRFRDRCGGRRGFDGFLRIFRFGRG